MKIPDEWVEAMAIGFIAMEGVPNDYEKSMAWARQMHDTYKEAEHECKLHRHGTCMRCLIDDGYLEAKRAIFACRSVYPLIARAENEACAEVAKYIGEFADMRGREGPYLEGWEWATVNIEAAIRARHATPTDSTPQEK